MDDYSIDERKGIEKEQKQILAEEKAKYHEKDFTKDKVDQMIQDAIASLTENKQQFFDMYELLMKERTLLENQITRITKEINDLTSAGERLTKHKQQLRQMLADASSRFLDREEERIYNELVSVLRQSRDTEAKGKQLWKQRESKRRRIKELKYIICTTKRMVTSMGAVTSYLTQQMTNITTKFSHLEESVHINERIINAHEVERLRISRELHDTAVQDLASLLMQAELCQILIRKDRKEEAEESLVDIRKGIQGSISGIRQAIFEMRPMALDDLGLIEAIHEFCHITGDRYHRDIRYVDHGVDAHPVMFPKYMEIAVFRIVQEAIRNAVKHGDASVISVRVSAASDALTIQVADNGGGFDPDEMFAKEMEDSDFSHYGLLGMKERAEQIGGELTFDAKVGSGTTVKLRIPYDT